MRIICQYKYIFTQIIINIMSTRLIIPIKFLNCHFHIEYMQHLWEWIFSFLKQNIVIFLLSVYYHGLTKPVIATSHLFGRHFKIINLQINLNFKAQREISLQKAQFFFSYHSYIYHRYGDLLFFVLNYFPFPDLTWYF